MVNTFLCIPISAILGTVIRLLFLYLLLLVLTVQPLGGQVPFVCRGDYFISLTLDGSSSIFRVGSDVQTGAVQFEQVGNQGIGFTLNAIGFRSTDNYIYGINQENLGLYRVGADGKAELLSILDGIDTNLDYPAGDITPDGRYLVLLGGRGDFFIGGNGRSEALVFIDLESPAYEVRMQALASNNVRCFDVAFDPESGNLYGFDAIHQQLVLFDPNSGAVQTGFAPDKSAELIGSLFFDAFGQLYGYGRPGGGQSQNTFFRIDRESGQVLGMAAGPAVQRTDGCSCPYTIEMEKAITPERVLTCGEQTVTLTLVNASGRTQDGLTLTDVFPEGVLITDIVNPLQGTVVSGPGSHRLQIENMEVPAGEHIIEVKTRSQAGVSGAFENQAVLTGLPEALGELVLSDNPVTLAKTDPTPFNIDGLRLDFEEVRSSLCTGETIVLDPAAGPVDYLWSDGSRDTFLTVSAGGSYSLTVTSACETATTSIDIEENKISVELPSRLELLLGDSLQLEPAVTGTPPFTFAWEGDAMSCRNCPVPIIRPLESGFFTLETTDGNGCRQRDSVFVTVNKDRRIYIPNAFTPNGDGINDRFYVQSRQQEQILSFRIFSRWGGLLYEARELTTNDAGRGWDGTVDGHPLDTGVYLYQVRIHFRDGTVEEYAGEVVLLQ
jgi:gliding motility-associated-like protein